MGDHHVRFDSTDVDIQVWENGTASWRVLNTVRNSPEYSRLWNNSSATSRLRRSILNELPDSAFLSKEMNISDVNVSLGRNSITTTFTVRGFAERRGGLLFLDFLDTNGASFLTVRGVNLSIRGPPGYTVINQPNGALSEDGVLVWNGVPGRLDEDTYVVYSESNGFVDKILMHYTIFTDDLGIIIGNLFGILFPYLLFVAFLSISALLLGRDSAGRIVEKDSSDRGTLFGALAILGVLLLVLGYLWGDNPFLHVFGLIYLVTGAYIFSLDWYLDDGISERLMWVSVLVLASIYFVVVTIMQWVFQVTKGVFGAGTVYSPETAVPFYLLMLTTAGAVLLGYQIRYKHAIRGIFLISITYFLTFVTFVDLGTSVFPAFFFAALIGSIIIGVMLLPLIIAGTQIGMKQPERTN